MCLIFQHSTFNNLFFFLALVLVLQDQNYVLWIQSKSIIKCRKRVVTILQHQLPVKRQGAYFRFWRREDREQISQRQSWKITDSWVYHRSYSVREEKVKCGKSTRLLSKTRCSLRLPHPWRTPKTWLYLCKGGSRCRHFEVLHISWRRLRHGAVRRLPSGFFSLLSCSVTFPVP